MRSAGESRRRFRRAPDEKRRAILSVARRCFSERGYDETTTAEIARQAGVAEGTIFNHFRSKRGLLEAVVVHHASDLTKVMIEATDWETPSVERPIRRALDFARKTGRIAVLSNGPQHAKLRAMIRRKLREQMVRSGAEVFERWQASGIVRPMNAAIVSELLYSMIDVVLRHGSSGEERDLEAYVREAVRCFEGAIAPTPLLAQDVPPQT